MWPAGHPGGVGNQAGLRTGLSGATWDERKVEVTKVDYSSSIAGKVRTPGPALWWVWVCLVSGLLLVQTGRVCGQVNPQEGAGGRALSGQFIIRPEEASRSKPSGINLSANPLSARSVSGQFIIHDGRAASEPSPALSLPNRRVIRIEPPLLTVSCERIKYILTRELGAMPAWRGKIFLALHSAADAEEVVTITAEHFTDGWQYRVDLADQIERDRFVRSMVQVLLLETANRSAGERSAEIPAWLIEGLTQQLINSSELELVIAPPTAMSTGFNITSANVEGRREHPLEQAHKDLLASRLLTFEELSWPTAEQVAGAVYQSSAQLFVSELLHLKEGRESMRAMLAELPAHYNWQFAFMRGFEATFQKPLDVEKWWALTVVHFTGRELAQTWPLEESWRKLNAIVREGIQIRSSANEQPLHTEVSLQTIIREWDRARQLPLLQSKVGELNMLRLRVAQELVPVVDGYLQALERYLEHNRRPGFGLPLFKQAAINRAVETALTQLDDLDSQRASLKPEPKPLPAVAGRQP